MCGIAGIVDLHGGRPVDREAVVRMQSALAHRGPDGEGLYIDTGIGLAHRRLAVIDLAGSAQPFHSGSGRHVLSFNGEIYNFQELRDQLEQAGQPLISQGDTEVLAELWEQQGPEALQALTGMFAFAIWDKVECTLTLARDRFGEKPIYYAVTDDGFLLFASEVNALLASGLIRNKLNEEAILHYFCFGYVPEPLSIYRDVHKLPAGHCLQIRQGRVEPLVPTAYWQAGFQPDTQLSYDDAVEELEHILATSVERQMVADVPLGAFLSGGVDSSVVVASMATQSAQPVQTCSIGFEDASHDERQYARTVAEQYKTAHTEHLVTLDAQQLIDPVAKAYGEPFADSSALPTWTVCELARQQVTVALTGDGGDEIFAGYRRYPFFAREERLKALMPAAIRQPLFGIAATLYPKLDWAPQRLRLKTSFAALSEERADGYLRSVSISLPERLSAMLARTDALDAPRGMMKEMFHHAGTDDPVLAAQYVDMKTWLPGRMLVKTDRASMAHSLELRTPFLDHRLAEWAGRLPRDFKLRDSTGKRILKDTFASSLPHEVLHRRKQGFALPVAKWLRAAANNPLSRLEQSDLWKDQGTLNVEQVYKMISAHKPGRQDFSQELWAVIMFDAFLQQAS